MQNDKLIFDYMFRDEVCSHVEVDLSSKEVTCQNFTTNKWNTVFGKCPPNIENLNDFFEERCFPYHRADRDFLLNLLGLTQYNPLDIVMKTRGTMISDKCWIRFENDKSYWDEEINDVIFVD